jgi:molybdopterin/thiamine biosynthesis adenylyltransferase
MKKQREIFMLTESDLIRYGRQISYPGFGEEGQMKLKRSHVVVAGLGGLGTASSVFLACGGIGHITLVDGDLVELSNLNRQILHWEGDIGRRKTLSAARKLAKLNPSVKVTPVFKRITRSSVGGIIEGAHAVIDGMDNFETRSILNAACVGAGIPFIHAGINRAARRDYHDNTRKDTLFCLHIPAGSRGRLGDPGLRRHACSHGSFTGDGSV